MPLSILADPLHSSLPAIKTACVSQPRKPYPQTTDPTEVLHLTLTYHIRTAHPQRVAQLISM